MTTESERWQAWERAAQIRGLKQRTEVGGIGVSPDGELNILKPGEKPPEPVVVRKDHPKGGPR